jgi:hypothetical protein
MLIAKETSDALDILYGKFFDLNATLDRAVSILLNDWAMPQANDIIHHKIAHATPLLADLISEIKDNYNLASIRPAVHADSRNYANLADMFNTIVGEFEDTYQMIKMTDKIAKENNDENVHADLLDFMTIFNKFIGQMYTLRDKAVQMPDSYDEFDAHISMWGINGLD